MKTSLTKEDLLILERNKIKYIKNASDWQDFDNPDLQKKITTFFMWLYAFCKLKTDFKIYYAKDPIEQQVICNKLLGTKKKYYSSYCFVSIYYQSWFAYYKTMQDIGVKLTPDFDKLHEYIDLGIYSSVLYNNFIVLSEKPSKIIFNANGVIHNPDGPAIEWKSGYKVYAINGRIGPAWIWEKGAKGEITRNMFLKETNLEIKAMIYAVLGQRRIAELLDTIVIDTQEVNHPYGKETVQLLRSKEKYSDIDNEYFMWISVTCPSTGTQYMLGCEPTEKNALEALSKRAGLKSSEYKLNLAT